MLAFTKNDAMPRPTPKSFLNDSLRRSRRAMIAVMSASLNVVSIAAVCCASTSRRAMVWRRLVMRTRSSVRSPIFVGAILASRGAIAPPLVGAILASRAGAIFSSLVGATLLLVGAIGLSLVGVIFASLVDLALLSLAGSGLLSAVGSAFFAAPFPDA